MRHLPLALTLLAGSAAPAAFAQDADDEIAALEKRTIALHEQIGRSLVCIKVTTAAVALPTLALPGLVTIRPNSAVTEELEGSGFVISSEGHIATTFDLVAGAAQVEVRFHDGTTQQAKVVGVDVPFALGVLATEGVPKGALPLAADANVNPRDGSLGWFFTADLEEYGAVDTQLGGVRGVRPTKSGYDRFLAATVRLYSGAAGSPLVDRNGKLLGMAIGSRPATHASSAHKLAPKRTTLFIRGDDVLRAAREVLAYGRVRRGMLGVLLKGDSNEIDQTIPGGPAERAGVIEGDRLISIEGRLSHNGADVTRTLLRRRPGDTVSVVLQRKAKTIEREIALAQVAFPPVPSTPPLEGVTLELRAVLEGDSTIARTVVFREVDTDSLLYQAGVRVGDRLLQVDERDALNFLARHRIRPAAGPPGTLRVERAGRKLTVRVDDGE